MFLESFDVVAVFSEGRDAEGSRFCAADRGHDWRAGVNGGGANSHFIGARGLAGGRVDDEVQFAIFEKVERLGTALGKLEDSADFQAGLFQHASRSAPGDDVEA